MQQSLYQNNRQSLLMMAGAIFVSVTAAVIVSTVIIMSLMRGEIAGALASNVQNSSPTAQTASSCAVPQNEQTAEAVSSPEVTSASAYSVGGAAKPLVSSVHFAKYTPPTSIHNSFNSSNVSNTTTTNNIKNTEVNTNLKVTNIKDSFNDNSKTANVKVIKDSFNPVIIKDNTVNVNSNNNTAVNSGNTIENKKIVTVIDNSHTTTNVASNNVTNSNNTIENHLLSDNTAIIAPIVAPVPVPSV